MATPIKGKIYNLLWVSLLLIVGLGTSPSLAATYTVNDAGDTHGVITADGICSDSAGNCTLRAALEQAGASSGGDTIVFNLSLPATIYLTIGTLNIPTASGPVSIIGPGASELTVEPRPESPGGGGLFRIFSVIETGQGPVTISKLTVARGRSGGIANNTITTLNLEDVVIRDNEPSTFGGGILSSGGAVNITRCTIRNNTATAGGGGISTTNVARLAISGSTISDNRAPQGGGIRSAGLATIVNSTITNNVSVESSGGLSAVGGGILSFHPLILTNVTVSHNRADFGGGVSVTGNESSFQNTLIAENRAATGPDVFAATDTPVVSLGYNLIGNGTGGAGLVNGINGDQIGTAASSINPMLGPLQANGGATATREILFGSPAIDAANPAAFPERDQRDFLRPADGNVDGNAVPDIGAVERTELISIGGRVVNPAGLGLRNLVVTLIDSEGIRRSVAANSFGLYLFAGVRPEESYVLTVSSKRYRFAPRSLQPTSSVANVDFVALE